MEALLVKVNELYELKLNSFEKVMKGFLSENYILFQDDNKYFLKRYRFDNQKRIEEVHSVKQYFSEGGIRVILPIINLQGNTFFLFENAYFALFPFVADKQLDRGNLSDTAIISLGETLGKIHKLGKVARLSIQERFKSWDKKAALEKIDSINSVLLKTQKYTDFDKMALESVKTKRKLILENELTYENLALPSDHLIHGDYLDQNVFFDVHDKVSYVFDLEKTDYSPRMYELWRSLMYSFLSADVTSEDIRKAKLYLESYVNIYPTTKDELLIGLKLFYLKSIHGVWVESEHYLKESDRVDKFLHSDFKRIQYLSNNFDDFEIKLVG